jgi:hypothetical protein
LTSIPVIPGLKRLYCGGCTSLTSVPIISGLKNLFCENCPWLKTENVKKVVIIQRLWMIKKRKECEKVLMKNINIPTVIVNEIIGWV